MNAPNTQQIEDLVRKLRAVMADELSSGRALSKDTLFDAFVKKYDATDPGVVRIVAAKVLEEEIRSLKKWERRP